MKDWQFREFEDCIERVTYTPKVQRKDFLDVGTFPIVSQEQDYINGYWNDAKAVFKVTKPVVIFGDHTQVIKYIDFDFVLGADGVKILQPTDDLFPRYFYYFLQRVDLKSLGYARHYRLLKEVSVPVPPIEEQRRIVAILDEAFSGLDKAKQNAEKNLRQARELFESHLQSVFTQRGNGWVETAIGDAIRFIDYRGKTPAKTASGIRLITAKNVKMGYLQETPMEFIATSDYKAWMTRGIPEKGDVLFTTEAPLANVAQLDTDERVAFAQRIIIMQPEKTRLDCTFLKYLLLSRPVQQRIRSQGTGATVQGIKASLLKLIEISFPKTLSEQKRIVDGLDGLSGQVGRLESVYRRKVAALDELKKSLLHRAFSGEL